jgi:hypothetical protein
LDAPRFLASHTEIDGKHTANLSGKHSFQLQNATTSLMGHGVLLGITPTMHPILQHVARNAAAMEADGFNIDDIPPFEWDSTDLTFRAIVAAPSDAWWEDLDALREDPDPMNWEYIPNMKGNNQVRREFRRRSPFMLISP